MRCLLVLLAGASAGLLASCSGTTSTTLTTRSTPKSASVSTGTISDWLDSVCQPDTFVDRHGTGRTTGGGVCAAAQSIGGIFILQYGSAASAQSDLQLGFGGGDPFAQLTEPDGATWVFVAVNGAGSAAVSPLTRYGFELGTTPEASQRISDGEPSMPPQASFTGVEANVIGGQPCGAREKYVFGRDVDGNLMACHWAQYADTFLWDGPLQGSLVGVREPGMQCLAGETSYAQSPDGYPLACSADGAWARN